MNLRQTLMHILTDRPLDHSVFICTSEQLHAGPPPGCFLTQRRPWRALPECRRILDFILISSFLVARERVTAGPGRSCNINYSSDQDLHAAYTLKEYCSPALPGTSTGLSRPKTLRGTWALGSRGDKWL